MNRNRQFLSHRESPSKISIPAIWRVTQRLLSLFEAWQEISFAFCECRLWLGIWKIGEEERKIPQEILIKRIQKRFVQQKRGNWRWSRGYQCSHSSTPQQYSNNQSIFNLRLLGMRRCRAGEITTQNSLTHIRKALAKHPQTAQDARKAQNKAGHEHRTEKSRARARAQSTSTGQSTEHEHRKTPIQISLHIQKFLPQKKHYQKQQCLAAGVWIRQVYKPSSLLNVKGDISLLTPQ